MSGIDKDKLKIQTRDSLALTAASAESPPPPLPPETTAIPVSSLSERPATTEQPTAALSPVAPTTTTATITRAEYVKYLVTCICFLPQFRSQEDPPSHKFVVFSELDDLANVKPSFVKCNNCGIIHRVTEVGTSHTIGKEDSRALEVVDDIRSELPDWLVGLLEKNECEIHVWQEARFILKNFLYGRHVILIKERQGNVTLGKACVILGKNMHKIENFEIIEETN